MKTAQNQLDQWFSKAPGKLLLEAENDLLNQLLPKLFGYYFLQLGGPSAARWLNACRIPQRIHIGANCPCNFNGSCIVADLNELPLTADSVDVVLLPHILEFAEQPQQILQEAYRVLIPEGYMVIVGFHPWSLLGLMRLFNPRKQAPWRGKFYSEFRIRNWLNRLGCSIEDYETLFFRPPIKNRRWLNKLSFLETMSQLLLPYLGGIYIIVAKKRKVALTPIKVRFKKKRAAVRPRVAQPTARLSRKNF